MTCHRGPRVRGDYVVIVYGHLDAGGELIGVRRLVRTRAQAARALRAARRMRWPIEPNLTGYFIVDQVGDP